MLINSKVGKTLWLANRSSKKLMRCLTTMVPEYQHKSIESTNNEFFSICDAHLNIWFAHMCLCEKLTLSCPVLGPCEWGWYCITSSRIQSTAESSWRHHARHTSANIVFSGMRFSQRTFPNYVLLVKKLKTMYLHLYRIHVSIGFPSFRHSWNVLSAWRAHKGHLLPSILTRYLFTLLNCCNAMTIISVTCRVMLVSL